MPREAELTFETERFFGHALLDEMRNMIGFSVQIPFYLDYHKENTFCIGSGIWAIRPVFLQSRVLRK